MGQALVLVAEDMPDAREAIAELLADAGFAVAEAENGPQAVEVAIGRRPDLILLDLTLPELTGAEVIRALRSDERTRHIPVAVVTGHSRGEELDQAVRAGSNAVLIKPFDVDELLAVVSGLLARASG